MPLPTLMEVDEHTLLSTSLSHPRSSTKVSRSAISGNTSAFAPLADSGAVFQFDLPPFHNATALDTVRTRSQTVNVMEDGVRVQSFHALAVAVWQPPSGIGPSITSVIYNFADNTSEPVDIIVAPWFSRGSIFVGPIFT